ncbi:hypothetical protein [Streptococcus sciuri]|uniref:Uncharacterized protein n=1 Tax=Streptococcus sciuri TaxID=2973939 RepID=A0ABT2F6A4_9STRE|nr:hypothetical protein [Streptococcus sciuri]MCS4487998.1 hypothetical protein [Streptococcus sciuri]
MKRVEIWWEFLQNINAELPAIKQKADELGLSLFYSINEDFIQDDALLLPLKEQSIKNCSRQMNDVLI